MLNALLVPRFRYSGRVSTLASYVVVAAAVYAIANRLHPLPVDARRLAIVLASGTAVMSVGGQLSALGMIQAVAAKLVLVAALIVFWSFFVLTDRERFRLHPAQLMRAH